MKYWKRTCITCAIVSMVALSFISCYQKPSQSVFYYDPSKNYAAFLVLNTAIGKNALESMKQHSIDEKYEIGPVEFYDPGTKDFESILRKLTANKQVQLVWIISSVWDIPAIKTAMTKVEYKGPYRYAPISDQAGQIKIDQ